MARERSLTLRIRAQVDGAKRALDDTAKAAKGVGTAAEQASRQATAASGRMAQSARDNAQAYTTAGTALAGFGLAGVAALGASAKAAVNWESAFAGVTKTVDDNATGYAALSDELRGMAREMPATASEIAGVAEAAGQLGVRRQDIGSFTETMVQLGATTNLSADEAATSIAQMANVMGTSGEDVDNLASTLVALGNDGASTEKQIIEMAQRISGAAAIVGLSEADVLAFANTVASMGIEVEAGGTSVSRVLTDMSKAAQTGGSDLAVFAETAGMSASEFATAFEEDPARAFAAFISGLGGVQEAGGNVFAILDELGLSDVRVSQALLGMASSGDLLTDSLDLGAKAWSENTALSDEFGKRLETTGSQLAIARNSVVDMGISIGNAFLPALGSAAEGVAGLAGTIADLPEPVLAAGAGLGAVASAGALAAGGLLLVVPRAVETYDAFQRLNVAHPRVTTGLTNVGKAAAGLVVLGVAVAGINALVERGEAATLTLQELNNVLVTELPASGDVIKTTFGDLFPEEDLARGKDFRAVLEGLADDGVYANITSGVGSVGDALTNWVGVDLDSGMEAVRERLGEVGNQLGQLAATDLPKAQEAFRALYDEAGGDAAAGKLLLQSMPELRGALAEVATSLGLTADETTLLKLATGELSGVSADAAGGLMGVAGAGDQLAAALDPAQVQAYASAMTNLASTGRGLREMFVEGSEAQRAWREEMAGINASFIDFAGAMSGGQSAAEQYAQAQADAAAAVADAQRGVVDAQQGLVDARESAAESAEDAAERVADAEQAIEDATEDAASAVVAAKGRVTDARAALVAAEESAAESAEDAAERVTDAQKGIEDATEDSAEAVIGAQARVIDARAALVDAEESAADAVKDAAQKVIDAQDGVDDAVRDGAQKAEDAADRVKDAQREATQAREDGARDIAAAIEAQKVAERSATDAQDDTRRSLLDLSDARRQARQELEDYNLSLQGAALGVEGAQIALERAKIRAKEVGGGGWELGGRPKGMTPSEWNQQGLTPEQLDFVNRPDDYRYANSEKLKLTAEQKRQGYGIFEDYTIGRPSKPKGSGGSLEQREASLAVRQAELRLKEARESNKDLRAEADAARKAGVEGSEVVLAAREKLAQSRRDEAEAERKAGEASAAISRARIEAVRSIAEAERGRADAVAEQTLAETESAEKITEARRGLTEAVAEQVRAQRDSTREVVEAQAAIREAQAEVTAAQVEGAERIAEAQASAADAVEEQVKSQRDAARQVVEAQQSVIDAQAAVTQAQQDATASQGVSVADWIANLEEQLRVQEQWEVDMLLLSGRVSQGTLDELARLGPEGAPYVAELVAMSDEELARLGPIAAQRGAEATGAIAAEMQKAADSGLIAAAMAQVGTEAAEEIARGIASGEMTVQEAIDKYNLVVDVDSDLSPAEQKVARFVGMAGETFATLKLAAEDKAAKDKLTDFVYLSDETTAVTNLASRSGRAKNALTDFVYLAEETVAVTNLTATGRRAKDVLADFLGKADESTGTPDIDADPKKGQSALDILLRTTDDSEGTVDLLGNDKPGQGARRGLVDDIDDSEGTVDLLGADALAQRVRRGLVDDIDDSSGTVDIKGDSEPANKTRVRLLEKIRASEATLNIDAAMDRAQTSMDKFFGKNNGRSLNISAGVTSQTAQASGGMWAGGVQAFAGGGMTQTGGYVPRQSMMGGPQYGKTNILWGEPETGWEAYISGKPGMEERNRRILAMAADRLGMSIGARYATGGMAGTMPATLNFAANQKSLDKFTASLQRASMSLLDGIGSKPGGAVSGDWRSLVKMVEPWNVPITSTVRKSGGRTLTGRESLHGLGKAIDTGLNKDLWDWLEPQKNKFRELYSPWGLWNRGKSRYAFPGADTVRRSHQDHIHIGAYADGGAVKGPGTGTSDSILMRGSNGEHMWTDREVRALGGHEEMYRLRKAALAGAVRYDIGGQVGASYGQRYSDMRFASMPQQQVVVQQASAAGPQTLSLSGVDLTLVVDGRPMAAYIREGATGVLQETARSAVGHGARRGGY